MITLAIIGVIAAMTIPSLMTNIQKRQSVAKLQTAISKLNQAYRLSYGELGGPTGEEARDMGIDQYFDTYWRPYMKVSELCKTSTQCGYSSNVPYYKIDGVTLVGSAFTYSVSRFGFITPDGFIYNIYVSAYNTDGGGMNLTSGIIIVDINGAKLPNRVGRDVFYLERQDDGSVQPYGFGKTDSAVNDSCKIGHQGSYCGEKIRRAGWKIDSTYPW